MAFLECPKEIENASNDSVIFYTIAYGMKKDRSSICYSYSMSNLGECELLLESSKEDKIKVSNDLYLEWMKLCQENSLIPPKVSYYKEKKKFYLSIPANLYDKHWLYTTLCCFRFADSYAKVVWSTVENCKASKDFTFWQSLHYALANYYGYGTGHSFNSIGLHTSLYTRGGAYNLAVSIAMKLVFNNKTIQERKKDTNSTYAYINDEAKKLANITCKGESELYISNLPDLLTDKYTQLYLLDKPNRESLLELYNKIK